MKSSDIQTYPHPATASARRVAWPEPGFNTGILWRGSIVLPGGAEVWNCSERNRHRSHTTWQAAIACARREMGIKPDVR